jgi:hypothetical protein
LFRKYILIVLLFIAVGAGVFTLLVFEKTPVASEHITPGSDDAGRVKDLGNKIRNILNRSHEIETLTVTEADINSVLNFVSRSFPLFRGQAEVRQGVCDIAGSLKVPGKPLGEYMNIRLRLLSSCSGMEIESISLGRIRVPGKPVKMAVRVLLDVILGGGRGKILFEAVKKSEFTQGKGLFVLRDIGDIRKEHIKSRVKKIRDRIKPVGDPEDIRVYYEKLSDLSEIYRGTEKVSLARYLKTVFSLAKERSRENDPRLENRAAIMALAVFCGSPRFEHFTGKVKTGKYELKEPFTRNIVLEKRRDLSLHFVVSAGIEILSRSNFGITAGEFKELLDLLKGGSGFSFSDLAADRAGSRFAAEATGSVPGAEMVQEVLSGTYNESYFFPPAADLPEGITQRDFEAVYGGIDNEKYLELESVIDGRIDRVYFFMREKQTDN